LKSSASLPPVQKRSRQGRSCDLRALGRDGHGRGNADENEQRRQEKSTADPEKARDETHRCAQTEHQQHVDGEFGNRQINLHCPSLVCAGLRSAQDRPGFTYSPVRQKPVAAWRQRLT